VLVDVVLAHVLGGVVITNDRPTFPGLQTVKHMESAGMRSKAGQELRLLDVPAYRRYGAYDELHGLGLAHNASSEDGRKGAGRAFADTLKRATAKHYGQLADMRFTDFIKTKIKPKGARLRPVDCERLLGHWAARYRHETTAVALAVLMLTHSTRISETRQAKWRYFDLVGKTWHIPAVDTKTKKAHTLPLTAQVCAFLTRYRASQSAKGYDGAYLFPGLHGQPLNRTVAQLAFSALAGGEWTSHDLRKAARTAWTDLGVDYLIGELLLNHALKALDVTYIHTSAEVQKRQALERWHAWLDERGFAALHSPADIAYART